MSTIVMSECWPLRMSPTQKAVLISLADNANDHGECWPAIETICARTCLAERGVQRALAALERDHALEIERRPGHSNRFRLTPARYAPPHDVHPARRAPHPRTTCTPPPHDVHLPPHDVHPEPTRTVKGTVKEPSRARSRVRASRLPDDWTPDADDIAFARRYGITHAEADRFRDYWRAAPGSRGVKSDWHATWRNWIRRAADGPPPRAAPASVSPTASIRLA